ncbi:hypothetical protein [Catenuloplanes indicus]|uniref:Uncharacterized protein n=1 Tax=Catenuloplanes indicus TaxID=137267 RepID=A0AAE4AVA9_9ACTN|nr:hypothetical protein [Catenuloplanes indicus]MDQ0363754.1 hypothetical protein [Catenuloplanes indicus]
MHLDLRIQQSVVAPGLESLLAAAGFGVEARHDYLICEPGSLNPPSSAPSGSEMASGFVVAGFEVREPRGDAERVALAAAQNEAFGGGPVATAADAARLERVRAQGGVVRWRSPRTVPAPVAGSRWRRTTA